MSKEDRSGMNSAEYMAMVDKADEKSKKRLERAAKYAAAQKKWQDNPYVEAAIRYFHYHPRIKWGLLLSVNILLVAFLAFSSLRVFSSMDNSGPAKQWVVDWSTQQLQLKSVNNLPSVMPVIFKATEGEPALRENLTVLELADLGVYVGYLQKVTAGTVYIASVDAPDDWYTPASEEGRKIYSSAYEIRDGVKPEPLNVNIAKQ